MKKPAVLRLWAVLCTVVIFSACQKETSQRTEPVSSETSNAYSGPKMGGAIPDDPAKVAKVPTIMSQEFLSNTQKYLTSPDMLSAKGKPVKSGTDATPPSVTITSPTNGSTVSGIITIQVNASDNVAVSSVSLNVDGALLGTTSTAPYAFTWNATTGSHTIVATARDAAGNSASNSISVSQNVVSSDITAPTVSITSPASGSTVSGTVSVAVSAADNVGVKSVSLSVDGTVVSTLSSAPYNFSWNTSNVADGNHSLSAKASDAAGNINTSTITMAKNTTIVTAPTTSLPSFYSLITPPVGNQGNEGSCVPFAIAYAARSIEQYYKTNASSYSFATNIFSPEYIYNQTKFSDCASGTSSGKVLDLLQSQGVVTWQSMPYSDINGCSLMPTASQLLEAANYKISSYVKIVNSDKTAIKTMVYANHPVIITIIADNSFVNAKSGFIWKVNSGTGALAHTLIICGFDDTKNAYKVMNSWGTSWADAGFSWIDYDFFPSQSSYYAYAIQ